MNNSSDSLNQARALALLAEVSNLLRSPSGQVPEAGVGMAASSDRVLPSDVRQEVSNLARFRMALPDGSAFSPRTAQDEVRRSFAPYARPSTSARQPRGSSRISGARVMPPRPREWVRAIYCLSGSEGRITPSLNHKLVLENNGLGAKVLKIDAFATEEELKEELRSVIPKLGGLEFELLKSLGGGSGRPLVRISSDIAVPKVQDLMALMARSLVYVYPLTEITLSQEDGDFRDRDSPISVVTETNRVAEDPAVFIEAPQALGLAVTIEEFRDQLYQEHAGFQPVFVQRDDFIMQVLGVYKSRNFNVLLKPQVIFAGEAGADAGALQKEYFWQGIAALRTGKFHKIPIFEGELDHMVPVCDVSLIRSGVLKQVGMFIVHGIIHCGLGFVGLSPAVVEYLTTVESTGDAPFTITVKDVADSDIRDAINLLETWPSEEDLAPDGLNIIKNAAQQCDYHGLIDRDSRRFLLEHLLYYTVITKRKPYLDAMKEAFNVPPLQKFLSGKEYLLPGLFPTMHSLTSKPEFIASKIQCSDHPRFADYMKEFIASICTESETLQKLLTAWTGWAILPDDPLTINVVENGEFCFHACFQELEVPQDMTKERFFQNIKCVLELGYAGFGST